jgi:outer membrane receptor protein involved in Fe transport
VYALDPFVLTDLSLNKSWTQSQHDFTLSFQVKNLFDKTYQLYAGRAMPGRNFNLKISYHLNRKKQ